MSESTEQTDVLRAIKRLTIAVWVLGLFCLLNLLIIFSPLLLSFFFSRDGVISIPPYVSPSTREFVDPYNRFHEWPIEKKIKSSSVIVLTTYKHGDQKILNILSEVLKQTPEIYFSYKVGDEVGSRIYPKKNVRYGDGQIIFFVGSPATERYATSYYQDRILGLGQMPLVEFRKMIQQVSDEEANISYSNRVFTAVSIAYWCKYGKIPKTLEDFAKVTNLNDPDPRIIVDPNEWLKNSEFDINGDRLKITYKPPSSNIDSSSRHYFTSTSQCPDSPPCELEHKCSHSLKIQ